MAIFKHFYLFYLFAFIFPFSIGSPAGAKTPDTPNTWVHQMARVQYTGDAISDRRKSKIDHGDILFTTSNVSHGLLLSCLEGKFRASIALEPKDLRAIFQNTSFSGLRYHGKFIPTNQSLTFIDMRLDKGQKIPLGRWFFDKTNNSVQSRKRKAAAKLYNAVVRGQTVTVLTEGHLPFTLELPKPNQAFANFGAKCGLGINAKKK